MQKAEKNSVIQKFHLHPWVKETAAIFQNPNPQKVQWLSTMQSGRSMALAALFEELNQPMIYIARDKEEAAYFFNDFQKLIGENKVLFFPASHRRPYQFEDTNNANVVLRTEVLRKWLNSPKNIAIFTYPNALSEKVIKRKSLKANTLEIQKGEKIDLDFLNETLFAYHFKRVDFVTQPGEFSVRGGIVDVFSFSDEQPYRISFFGNEAEDLRMFDLESQLSIKKLNKIKIIPNISDKNHEIERVNFLDYAPSNSLLAIDELNLCTDILAKNYQLAEENFTAYQGEIDQLPPNELFTSPNDFQEKIQAFHQIVFQKNQLKDEDNAFRFQQKPQPVFHKKFDLILENLHENTANGWENHLFCSSEKQATRLADIFADLDAEIQYKTWIETYYGGFIDPKLKIACYTDHQLFERFRRFEINDRFSKKESVTLKDLNSLKIGDYVTHIDHGVGTFAGLKKINNNGIVSEAIKLIYQNNDILYVSIHSLHKISKYSGKEGQQPKINRLGSPAWNTLKNKAKKKVKEMAFDLIKLYAKRQMQKGFAYSPDSYLQNELEASFLYEDTPDQLKATQDIKTDMEAQKPMDRLICGDVGFGKTEVAIRAAFKAATDSKQVAVLVPTTILAFQHYQTFKDRLKDFPVRVDYVSRFRSTKAKNEIFKDLESGKIDIIIGTHQLVNNQIKYKDLGLLIIDEEHKFGVAVKDKIKLLKANVDTLTLTATPIPRTLQFSLMAARDLSIIKTPPPNRQPTDTQIIGFNEEQIRDAVAFELQRGGQVFFIHNRIEGLKDIAGMLQRLVPDAKIATGHGQMEGKKLEDTMLKFMEGQYDILISTTIVESGLDVPNANTMLIHDAQNFGMADLHQMRGRVGRSNKKAFCYLITPPLSALTSEARKRLQAVEQFSDLGSGLNIAMKDLEIRGAGNLLGAEQSGFIADIGFDAYKKILMEAVQELKETDFKELFKDEVKPEHNDDFQLDTDLEVLIPDHYVNQVEERLRLYQTLSDLKNEQELHEFKSHLMDRFGAIPEEVDNIFDALYMKWSAQKIGFDRVVLKKNIFLGYFKSNPNYFNGTIFQGILDYMQHHPKHLQLKEKPAKNKEDFPSVLLRMDEVYTMKDAQNKLNTLWQWVDEKNLQEN